MTCDPPPGATASPTGDHGLGADPAVQAGAGDQAQRDLRLAQGGSVGVIAIDIPNDRAFIVTVYRPDPERWFHDWTRRHS